MILQLGNKPNSKRLKEIGKSGVSAMICDSTNANVKGFQVQKNLLKKVFIIYKRL